MIAGMSIGSWVLIAIIAIWAAVAIKIHFFGGFKKGKKKGFSLGGCCGSGGDCHENSCAGCHGCDHVRANAIMPEFSPKDK